MTGYRTSSLKYLKMLYTVLLGGEIEIAPTTITKFLSK
jgi:hypothetical protein